VTLYFIRHAGPRLSLPEKRSSFAQYMGIGRRISFTASIDLLNKWKRCFEERMVKSSI
jgi:hypothetical protein